MEIFKDYEEQATNIAENQDTYTFNVTTPLVPGVSQVTPGNSTEAGASSNTATSTNRFEF